MVKKLNVLASALLVTMLFIGCSEDQTSMSIEDIQGEAKIIGNLSYSEGQSFENYKFIELTKPAANKKVTVEVSYSSLSPNGAGSGYTSYEAMTDEKGNYEVIIPAVAKSEGMIVNVKPETFTGKRTMLKTVENGKLEFKEELVVFSYKSVVKTIKPNDIIVADMKYGFEEREIETGFNEIAPLVVKVGTGKLRISDDFPGLLNEAYMETRSNINVVVTATYNEMESGKTFKRNYGGTTGGDGKATINIPVREKACNLKIELAVLPFVENSFNFYKAKSDRISLSGIYEQYGQVGFESPVDMGTISFTGLEGVNTIIRGRMVFYQFDGQDTDYFSHSYMWNSLPF